jgi:hypothetical protein
MTAGPRLGVCGSKNLLLRSGSAPYVALLDDDDRWEPTFLGRSHSDAHGVASATPSSL